MSIKIACFAADDLSILVFCKTLSRLLADRDDIELVTISPMTMYQEELAQIQSRHIEIGMERFISPQRDMGFLFRLYRLFLQSKFTAVICFTTKPNIFGALAAWLAGVPVKIIAVRGLGRLFNEQTNIKGKILQWFASHLYHLAAIAADWVWFTNENDLSYFVERGIVKREKTFLTKNAVDVSDFSMDNISEKKILALRTELGLTEEDLVVIMVARLIWPKGIREFCEAAEKLRDRMPGLKFLLVAPEEPGSPSAVPPSYIHEMEAKANLKWLGFRKDVRELYALSDIATLPSYYKEGGYPRALLEPMAFGKPVIAADTADCRAPVMDGKNGYIVPPRDADAFASAIEKIASNPELRDAFGQYSLERVKTEFDDQMVFEELIERVESWVQAI
jgi:N,N'-diacetylbacillosaminyl-diphospho-undecaprenol alpha-1,3-N-acetylgalactosaminyltransferase